MTNAALNSDDSVRWVKMNSDTNDRIKRDLHFCSKYKPDWLLSWLSLLPLNSSSPNYPNHDRQQMENRRSWSCWENLVRNLCFTVYHSFPLHLIRSHIGTEILWTSDSLNTFAFRHFHLLTLPLQWIISYHQINESDEIYLEEVIIRAKLNLTFKRVKAHTNLFYSF